MISEVLSLPSSVISSRRISRISRSAVSMPQNSESGARGAGADGCGLGAGLVFGTLKFFLAGGTAINWQSMLLDYSLAYMFVGFAGLLRGKSGTAWLAALIGCAARFLVHFVSGVTIYAEYMEDIFGLHMTNVWVYSLLYNGSYMLPNTILAVAAVALLAIPLKKYLRREDLR